MTRVTKPMRWSMRTTSSATWWAIWTKHACQRATGTARRSSRRRSATSKAARRPAIRLRRTSLLTTKEYDDASGLYYFNARWYDPELGRFVNKALFFPELEHQYSYCENDPFNLFDPDGEFPGGAAGVAAACCFVDGPFPVGDIFGAVILVGAGGYWICCGGDLISNYKEHRKGKRRSQKHRHYKGKKRKKYDKGGEKGDARRPYTKWGRKGGSGGLCPDLSRENPCECCDDGGGGGFMRSPPRLPSHNWGS